MQSIQMQSVVVEFNLTECSKTVLKLFETALLYAPALSHIYIRVSIAMAVSSVGTTKYIY